MPWGTGTVVLGAASGSANAYVQFGDQGTVGNAVQGASSASGSLQVNFAGGSTAETATGAITLNNNNNFILSNSGAGVVTFQGGVTGTGNLTVLDNASQNYQYLSITTAALNNAGTITFESTTNGSTTQVTGGIGSNVTGILEDSAVSPVTISTTAITVNSGGTTLTNENPAAPPS